MTINLNYIAFILAVVCCVGNIITGLMGRKSNNLWVALGWLSAIMWMTIAGAV